MLTDTGQIGNDHGGPLSATGVRARCRVILNCLLRPVGSDAAEYLCGGWHSCYLPRSLSRVATLVVSIGMVLIGLPGI